MLPTSSVPTFATAIERDGFAVIPDVLLAERGAALIDAIDGITSADAVRQKQSRTFAVRNLLRLLPAARELADSPGLRRCIEPIIGGTARAVRGILFDKVPGANWKVAWHQDLSIAVRERRDVPGWGPWSVKAGVVHVQPPVETLRRMLTVRLHLDDCGPDNGALQVLPGSHRAGALSDMSIADWRSRVAPALCTVGAGGVLLMRPLLLHASSSATSPSHRRVIHIEYSPDELPDGLAWSETEGA